MKITLFFGVLTLLPFLPAQAPRPAKTPVKTSAAAAPEFKAIWEPVNFKKDIKLTGVWFVSAEQGWAVGDKTPSSTPQTAARTGRSSLAVTPNHQIVP